jgi:putative ABC transport system permease protein
MNPYDSLDDDIRDHIERETQDNIDRGMTPPAARLAALRKFGNVARVIEDTRDVWRHVWLDQLLQDLRYGLRFLRRNPRFAAIVTLTMALGIGVNTAVFSVVNTVLLKPVGYPDAARLVWIGAYDPNIHRDFARNQDYLEWRRLAHSYSCMAAYGLQQPAVRTPRGSSQLTGIFVGGDFWRMTAAQPAAGRLFADTGQDCVVLTWDYFQREFSGDASIVGRAITLNGHPATITGVLPKTFRFQFPMWWAAAQPDPVEAYLTLPRPGEGIAQSMQVVAALKPGATVQQAQSELTALEQHLGRTDDLRVEPLERQLGGGSRKALLILMAAGACVLLIAIVNVANLLLARATLRHREVAIRAAVGAGRGRVLRQMLAESLLQSVAGGAAGLLLARGALAVLIGISPYAVPRLAETTIDGRVLLFTLALSLSAGLAFGALPALTLRRGDLQSALKSGARTTCGGFRLRRLLVAAELALAIVLLTGAGLMLKSFARMNAHAPNFDPDDVAVMKVRFTGGRDADAFVRELLHRIDTLPGVRAAGVSCWIQQGQRINAVSPGYLPALGMRLRQGRWLAANEPRVALINESMARRTFTGLDPLGRQVLLPRPYTVVGVVADVKYTRLDADPPPEVYIPIERAPDLYGLEIAAAPKSILPALRREVRRTDPSLPVFDVKTLGDALSQSIAPRRFNLFLLAGFAAAALLLAIVGIYGVTAYSVAGRTREIGMRMALGARRGQVAAMVLREMLPIALAGIAAGLIATRALAAVLASLLYDVQPTDPATYAAVALILALVAVTACLGPAWKAATIDPLVALRQVG